MKSKRLVGSLVAVILILSSVMVVFAYTNLGVSVNYAVNSSIRLYNNRSSQDAWNAPSGSRVFTAQVTSGSKAKFELKQWTVFDVLVYSSDVAVNTVNQPLWLNADDYFFNAIYDTGASSGHCKLS